MGLRMHHCFVLLFVLVVAMEVMAAMGKATNNNEDESNYELLSPKKDTKQEQGKCKGACDKILICPEECPDRKPNDKKKKGCFINCGIKCEATCKPTYDKKNSTGADPIQLISIASNAPQPPRSDLIDIHSTTLTSRSEAPCLRFPIRSDTVDTKSNNSSSYVRRQSGDEILDTIVFRRSQALSWS